MSQITRFTEILYRIYKHNEPFTSPPPTKVWLKYSFFAAINIYRVTFNLSQKDTEVFMQSSRHCCPISIETPSCKQGLADLFNIILNGTAFNGSNTNIGKITSTLLPDAPKRFLSDLHPFHDNIKVKLSS
jgi:hypothetical protein